MSSHIIYELETTLSQSLQVDENRTIKKIAIKAYWHLDPAGTFILTIKQGSNTIITKSLTSAEIMAGAGWTAGQYHVGYLLFDFDKFFNLYPETDYTIELSASGYTYADSSFIGWAEEHENNVNSSGNTFGYRLYGPKRGGTVRIIDFFDGQSSASAPTFESVSTATYFYIGDESTDGSWRIYADSGALKFEKRISGAWTLAENMEALA